MLTRLQANVVCEQSNMWRSSLSGRYHTSSLIIKDDSIAPLCVVVHFCMVHKRFAHLCTSSIVVCSLFIFFIFFSHFFPVKFNTLNLVFESRLRLLKQTILLHHWDLRINKFQVQQLVCMLSVKAAFEKALTHRFDIFK